MLRHAVIIHFQTFDGKDALSRTAYLVYFTYFIAGPFYLHEVAIAARPRLIKDTF